MRLILIAISTFSIIMLGITTYEIVLSKPHALRDYPTAGLVLIVATASCYITYLKFKHYNKSATQSLKKE